MVQVSSTGAYRLGTGRDWLSGGAVRLRGGFLLPGSSGGTGPASHMSAVPSRLAETMREDAERIRQAVAGIEAETMLETGEPPVRGRLNP